MVATPAVVLGRLEGLRDLRPVESVVPYLGPAARSVEGRGQEEAPEALQPADTAAMECRARERPA